jgi:hypothetical protein
MGTGSYATKSSRKYHPLPEPLDLPRSRSDKGVLVDTITGIEKNRALRHLTGDGTVRLVIKLIIPCM